MYGWIVDGISSLFEPVTGPKPTDWPGNGNGNVDDEGPARAGEGARARARLQENHSRAAKRNYQRSVVGD